MQAIVTKYHGPTNTKGSRITAKASAGSVSVSYDCALSTEENHHRAAEKLVRKMNWTPDQGAAFEGRWIAAGLPGNNSGNVYVLASNRAVMNDGFDMYPEA